MYNHFLYRHIRLDKKEPFYIGIGTKMKKFNSLKTEFFRAYDNNIKRRNKIWADIVKKSDYKIEIILESDDYEFILNKEEEFISLYGRINLKTGCLANLTNGGEGTKGILFSEERNIKISKGNKGRIKSEQERMIISKRASKKIINKETGVVYSSIKEASELNNISLTALYQQLYSCSSICKYEYLDKSLNYEKCIKKVGKGGTGKKVKDLETGIIFNTIKEVLEYENITRDKFMTKLKNEKDFKYTLSN